jgi:membrane protein required for beta-lactamase induction
VPGWLVVVGVPVLLVALAQLVASTLAGLLTFALHVTVLYLAVGLGAFHRQFSELRLLMGAGEEGSARVVLELWIGAGDAAGDPAGTRSVPAGARTPAWTSSRALMESAASHAVLAAYRDIFAPLFFYVVLPGPLGPVMYLFARFAAALSIPFARICR